ncbi:MAG: TolC family outer membrane protein [Gammaproteobacteria bacterium]|nr:TolC family outer membrane protein [Gammaproteobacteria bacterium]
MRAVIKRLALSISGAALCVATVPSYAIDLKEVYHQAVNNDQELNLSLGELRETAEQSPKAWSFILPQIEATGTGTLSKTYKSGNNNISDLPTTRQLDYGITLEQTLFDSSAFSGLSVAHHNIQAAYAAFKASQQDLITRTISAYLYVLEQEDLLSYAEAEKRALYEQYRQADESFKVGVTTITDVYQAKAFYDGAVSKYIAAKNEVANAFEALSVITGKVYNRLTPLSEGFPLVSPNPANINQWVVWTNRNNATIRQYCYLSQAAKNTIRAQWGQHLPSLSADLNYGGTIQDEVNENDDTLRTRTPSAAIKLTIPISSGGLISAEVREAAAQYEQAQANLELNRRQEVEAARKAYLAIVSGVSQVKADLRTIVSDKSALDATVESYKVGTQTMVDVLNAEQQLYEDLSTYATDRYTYVNAIISLKEAAGTLNSSDIIKLNSWMTNEHINESAIDRLNRYIKNNQQKVDAAMKREITEDMHERN